MRMMRWWIVVVVVGAAEAAFTTCSAITTSSLCTRMIVHGCHWSSSSCVAFPSCASILAQPLQCNLWTQCRWNNRTAACAPRVAEPQPEAQVCTALNDFDAAPWHFRQLECESFSVCEWLPDAFQCVLHRNVRALQQQALTQRQCEQDGTNVYDAVAGGLCLPLPFGQQQQQKACATCTNQAGCFLDRQSGTCLAKPVVTQAKSAVAWCSESSAFLTYAFDSAFTGNLTNTPPLNATAECLQTKDFRCLLGASGACVPNGYFLCPYQFTQSDCTSIPHGVCGWSTATKSCRTLIGQAPPLLPEPSSSSSTGAAGVSSSTAGAGAGQEVVVVVIPASARRQHTTSDTVVEGVAWTVFALFVLAIMLFICWPLSWLEPGRSEWWYNDPRSHAGAYARARVRKATADVEQ